MQRVSEVRVQALRDVGDAQRRLQGLQQQLAAVGSQLQRYRQQKAAEVARLERRLHALLSRDHLTAAAAPRAARAAAAAAPAHPEDGASGLGGGSNHGGAAQRVNGVRMRASKPHLGGRLRLLARCVAASGAVGGTGAASTRHSRQQQQQQEYDVGSDSGDTSACSSADISDGNGTPACSASSSDNVSEWRDCKGSTLEGSDGLAAALGELAERDAVAAATR